MLKLLAEVVSFERENRHRMYLNCKTYFSFHYGTYSTAELKGAGAETGATTLALTNIKESLEAQTE